MKKIFTISALLLAATLSASAQSEVLFKMKMLPDHQYAANMKMNMDMDMSGVPQSSTGSTPQKMLMEMNFTMDMKTGSVNGKKEFPVVMNMQMSPATMTMNGKTSTVPMPNKSIPTMYGKCGLDGLPRIDSIPGTPMNDSIKTAMNKMMEAFQNNIKFPDKPMKVGDSFVQDMPFNLPMMGGGMKTEAKITYKLISIAGGKANFDIASTMNMDMAVGKGSPVAMHMTGGGTGSMEYDIATSYPTHHLQNMDINMTMPAGDKTMTMKMKMKLDMQAVVK